VIGLEEIKEKMKNVAWKRKTEASTKQGVTKSKLVYQYQN
jgi:hypothetical protein